MIITASPIEIVDGLWMLGNSAYPLYLFQGNDQLTLFEGGIGTMGPVLREQFSELGFRWDQLRQLVITHAHPDHVMAVPFVKQLASDLKVMASGIAAKTLAVEKVVKVFCAMDDALCESLIDHGMFREEQRRPAFSEMRIDVDHVLHGGDSVVVDDSDPPTAFEVHVTKGHSDCSLSFFEPQRKILVISDVTGFFLPEHDGWWPNYFASYEDYVTSIKRIAELEAETLCLSHNGVVTGKQSIAQYFKEALDETEAYHKRICDEVQGGKSVREVAEVLGSEIHGRVPRMPVEFFQKNCGILVKQSVRHEGIKSE